MSALCATKRTKKKEIILISISESTQCRWFLSEIKYNQAKNFGCILFNVSFLCAMCWLRNEMGFALFGFYVFEFRQKLRESIWGKNRINKISFCKPIAFGSLAVFPFLFLLFFDGCYTENGPSIFAESVLYFLPANQIQKTRRKVPMLKVKLLTTKSRLNFCFIRDCFAKCWKLVLFLKQQRIQMPCCIYKAKIAGNIRY